MNKNTLDAQHMYDQLMAMHQGLAAMGVHHSNCGRIARRLLEIDAEVVRLRASDLYEAGYSDGHEAAFATGLTHD